MVSPRVRVAKLDEAAWDNLKISAKPYLVKRDFSGRGWSQLVSTLNEARGYIYLLNLGCERIRFIPTEKRNGIETPDLIGSKATGHFLCEVKTIHVSDEEVRARSNIKSRSAETTLTQAFLNKLDNTLQKARDQRFSYHVDGAAMRIALVIPNFDDWPGEYKNHYYADIDNHLGSLPTPDYSVAFFNSRTAFHNHVRMKYVKKGDRFIFLGKQPLGSLD